VEVASHRDVAHQCEPMPKDTAWTNSSTTMRGLDSNAVWDFENGFYWFSAPTRLNKLLAHYELYKSITSLPGDIFELGVYKAASLIRLSSYRNLLENDFSRRIVGFDAFGAFPREKLRLASDLDYIEYFEKEGGDGLKKAEVELILANKGFRNVFLNEGNVFDTLPAYLQLYPATRIALLHLDMDVKEPTTFALEHLYDRVVPGGLLVFDDYNAVAGETDAVDAFVNSKGLRLEKLTYYSVPAFVRKPPQAQSSETMLDGD
jgi:hypothetical protein